MSDELEVKGEVEAKVETPVEVPVATAEEKTEETVDLAPDPATLKAEIERLQKVKQEAEEKAVYWRKQKAEARAEFFKEKGAERQAPPPEDLGMGPEPKQEAFDDYQKYLDAKIAFEVNKAKTTWDREQARKQTEISHQDRMANLQTKIEEGYKKYADFEEVALDRTVPITPMIMEILSEAETPQDIAYWLGKNRAEAIRISRLSPISAAREIAKIEVEMARSGGNTPSQPKIPSAPPPIRPLGSSNTVERALDKMSQKEFEAEMEKRTGRKF